MKVEKKTQPLCTPKPIIIVKSPKNEGIHLSSKYYIAIYFHDKDYEINERDRSSVLNLGSSFNNL